MMSQANRYTVKINCFDYWASVDFESLESTTLHDNQEYIMYKNFTVLELNINLLFRIIPKYFLFETNIALYIRDIRKNEGGYTLSAEPKAKNKTMDVMRRVTV